MSRWKLTFEAIDPRKVGAKWKVGILDAHYKRITINGHEKQHARIVLVHEVLQGATQRIYGGWSRPDMEACFVYTGCPNRDLKSFHIETPPPPQMVFLVFILPDGTIDDWAWRPSTKGKGMPDGIHGELIWSANPS